MTIRLETRRLVLRPLADDDAEAVQDYAGRWEIARMTTRIAHPYPEGAAAAWIAAQAAARDDGSEHSFAITPARTPEPEARPIGVVGLRGVEPGNLELGYWLAPQHWGQGLATEAAQAMVVYGFEKLDA
jgi:[ribosomal protein S5]-alanine N-acetyltransferase